MSNRIIPKLICLFAYLLLCSITVWSQEKTVTGVVSDEKGTPLPGATITVKNANRSVMTDESGTYKIKLPAGATTLVISFIGLESREVSIGSSTLQNISLKGTAGNLNEVVVIGYGSARRSSVTSSISSISERDIKNLPVAGVDQALQGKVAGVTVSTNGGQPGGGVSVRIRGITSVNGTDPLYVIDGIPILTKTISIPQDQLGGKAGQSEQSILATLNPNDIASIDILKDASAQAIYGSQGANGVVLITTKKGKSGDSKVGYDVYHGWQAVPKKLDVMNLQQFAQYYNSLIPEVAAASPGSMLTEIDELKNPAILGKGTNWQDALFQQGSIDNHQLSFSGGQNKTTYYFSLNYFNQVGTIIGSDFKRYATRFAIDQQVKPWLKAGITGNLSRSNQRITLTDGTETPTTIVLYNSPATPIRDAFGQFISTSTLGGSTFGYALGNPIATALLRDVRSIQNKAFGNLYAEINFTSYLSLRNEVNYDFQLTQNNAFQPKVTNETTHQTILAPSRLREDKNNSHYWALRNYLTFNKIFGKHVVNAVVGHEAQASYYDNEWVSAVDLKQNLKSINAGTIDPAGTNGKQGEWAMESYFGRASYTYNGRYAISGSVRRDGSSSFGPNSRIGYFSAGSVAWTVTNEDFAHNWDVVNYLKIRAGIGAVGNQNSPVENAYSTNIRLFPISPFGAGGIPANVGNPNLSWESVVTQNIGVDASLLNKRIDLSVDVYNKKTTDMVLAATLPVFAGLDPNPPNTAYKEIEPPVTNAGEMNNKGIDVSITSYNIQRNAFTWKTTLIFSRYKNKLVTLNSQNAILRGAEQDYTGSASVVNITQAGGAVGTFYGYKTDGLFRSLAELNNGTNWGLPVSPTGIYLGDIRYRDISGPKGVPDGMIGSEDVMVIGDPNPDFTYGITNTFQYKDFDFSFFLQGVQGSQIFNWTRKYTESMASAFTNQLSSVLDRYTPDNTNASMPRYNQWNNNNVRNSDRYIEDGSYLRIQNVSLGYNLPKKWLSAAGVSTARFYVSAQNLYTFTGYSGYDPEIGSFNKNVLTQNVDNGHYPTPRTVTIGANIQF